jgi:hypothetical protein
MRHAKFALAVSLFLVLAQIGFAEELNPFKVGYAKLKITATKSITASDMVNSAYLTSYHRPFPLAWLWTLTLKAIRS